jgi:hypothetical protein
MRTVTTEFRACRPVLWTGRYGRVEGNSGVFHLRYCDGDLWPVVDWNTVDGLATCRAVASNGVPELAAAVATAKRLAAGEGGGGFVINEFGQVLVPSSDGSGVRFLAGRFEGRLLFENPFDPQAPIDLADDEDLENGDPWKLPYIGIPYNLDRRGTIYFYRQDDSGGRATYPPTQDHALIRAIRNVRPHGPVRIVVNPAGLVLTKVPVETRWQSEECWQALFVGSINRNLWFEEE